MTLVKQFTCQSESEPCAPLAASLRGPAVNATNALMDITTTKVKAAKGSPVAIAASASAAIGPPLHRFLCLPSHHRLLPPLSKDPFICPLDACTSMSQRVDSVAVRRLAVAQRVHQWLISTVHLFKQLLFLLWTAFLTYRNGPYYTMLELFRNYQIFGYRKLDYEAEFTTPLQDKVCVITGGTRGIGLEVVRFLFSKGCTVITGTSTLPENATNDAIARTKATLLRQILKTELLDPATEELASRRLVVLPLELTSMSSVVTFANQIRLTVSKVDYLICNGGVMFVPFRLTRDNFESHMCINYLSHCLLILKLVPLLAAKATRPGGVVSKSRIIVVSSGAHHASLGLRLHDLHATSLFSVYQSYAQSKLALIMFTYRFNRWLQERPDLRDALTINCLHPGVCRTGLMERFNFFKLKFIQELPLFRSASEGAETILYVTLSEEEKNNSGLYFENCHATSSSVISADESLQEQLWKHTWNELLTKWITPEEQSQL